METLWLEIAPTLGAALWRVYRIEMSLDGEVISVHASASDPYGAWGRPSMMTVVGVRCGPDGEGAPLLKLETTWDEGENGGRLNEQTRYWLPLAAQERR